MRALSQSPASPAMMAVPPMLQPQFDLGPATLQPDASDACAAAAARCLRFLRLIHSAPYSRSSAAREGAIFSFRA